MLNGMRRHSSSYTVDVNPSSVAGKRSILGVRITVVMVTFARIPSHH